MTSPVRCQCGAIYDLGHVTVTARYADCSVWTTPCCGRVEDDRPWVRRYTELTRDEARAADVGIPDAFGRPSRVVLR